jgi:hypothetical protein
MIFRGVKAIIDRDAKEHALALVLSKTIVDPKLPSWNYLQAASLRLFGLWTFGREGTLIIFPAN